MYIPKTLHEENVHNSCLMGLIFSISWRVTPKKIKMLMGIWIFQKRFQKYRFQVGVWSQNLRFSYFSFALILKRIFKPKKRLEIFILFVWLDFSKDFQPNLEFFAKFDIFILFVWLDFKRIYCQIWRFSQNLRFSYFSFGLILKGFTAKFEGFRKNFDFQLFIWPDF